MNQLIDIDGDCGFEFCVSDKIDFFSQTQLQIFKSLGHYKVVSDSGEFVYDDDGFLVRTD